jgi:ADP-heptose:LPS heptosyltransferase
MNKAQSALLQKLAKIRQAEKSTPKTNINKPAWEQLLDKALEPKDAEEGSPRTGAAGEYQDTADNKTEPGEKSIRGRSDVETEAPSSKTSPAENPEIGVWSIGVGLGNPGAAATKTTGKTPATASPEKVKSVVISPAIRGTIKQNEASQISACVASAQDGPHNLVILRPDSVGDLILFEPVLRILRETWASTRIHMVCTAGSKTVAPLLPEGIEWHFLEGCSPFALPTVEGLEKLRAEFSQTKTSTWLLSSCPRKTWWDFVAPNLGTFERRISMGQVPVSDAWRNALTKAGLTGSGLGYLETISTPGEMPEAKRNLECAAYLLGGPAPSLRPLLSIPGPVGIRAASLLEEQGLKSGNFIACCPAGTANVRIKSWPAIKYAEALCTLASSLGQQILLLGNLGEEAVIKDIVRFIEERGGKASIWLGTTADDFATLCALLAKASFYLGNDTGPMHAAAALGRPVFGVFGGGTWPRFIPLATRGAAILRPMSCFGCDWQCCFGDAPCIRFVSTQTVVRTVLETMRAEKDAFKIIEEEGGRSGEMDELSRNASIHVRSLRGMLEHLTTISDEQNAYIQTLKKNSQDTGVLLSARTEETEQRLATIREQDSYIADMETRLSRAESESVGYHSSMELVRKEKADLQTETLRLSDIIRQQESYLKTLEQTKAEQSAALNASLAENQRAQAVIAEQTQYLESLKQQVLSLSSEKSKLESGQSAALNASLAEYQRAQAVIAEQTQYLESLKQQVLSLSSEKSRLESEQSAALSASLAEYQRAQGVIAEQAQYLDSLKQQVLSLSSEKSRLESEQSAALSASLAENQRAQGVIAEQTQHLDSLKEQAQALSNRLSSLQTQRDSLLGQVAMRDSGLEKAQCEIAALAERFAARENKIEETKKAAEQTLLQLTQERDELRAALAETQSFAAHLEALYVAASKQP